MCLSGLSVNVAFFSTQKAWGRACWSVCLPEGLSAFPHWVCVFLPAEGVPALGEGPRGGSSCCTVKLRTSRPRVPWVYGTQCERLI